MKLFCILESGLGLDDLYDLKLGLICIYIACPVWPAMFYVDTIDLLDMSRSAKRRNAESGECLTGLTLTLSLFGILDSGRSPRSAFRRSTLRAVPDTLIWFCVLPTELHFWVFGKYITCNECVLYRWLYAKFGLNENEHLSWSRHAHECNSTSTAHRQQRDGSFFHYLFRSRRYSVVLELIWC